MYCDNMFEVGCSYIVIHIVKCIIEIIKPLKPINGSLFWEIRIIKLLDDDHHIYYEGLVTNWLEEWCHDIKKVDIDINNYAELLALVL